MMQREDVLRRYRQLRAIGTHHHSAALKLMGRTLVANTEEEMTLVFDLAIYTAKEGRSRAIDRYAKVAQLPPDSDERSMLEAMRHAQFSIWRVAGRHNTCGLVVNDVLRQSESWLVDESLERSGASGCASPVGCATPIHLRSPAALSYQLIGPCSRMSCPTSSPAGVPSLNVLATIHALPPPSIAPRSTPGSWTTSYSTDQSSASPKWPKSSLGHGQI